MNTYIFPSTKAPFDILKMAFLNIVPIKPFTRCNSNETSHFLMTYNPLGVKFTTECRHAIKLVNLAHSLISTGAHATALHVYTCKHSPQPPMLNRILCRVGQCILYSFVLFSSWYTLSLRAFLLYTFYTSTLATLQRKDLSLRASSGGAECAPFMNY